MKKIILATLAGLILALFVYGYYPRSRAVVSDQANVSSQKEIKLAIMRFEYCQHIVVTPVTDGYNVACINVYAGE